MVNIHGRSRQARLRGPLQQVHDDGVGGSPLSGSTGLLGLQDRAVAGDEVKLIFRLERDGGKTAVDGASS